MQSLPSGQPPLRQPWVPPAPPRPDSPTYKNLRERAVRELGGEVPVPVAPAKVRPADCDEQAAIDMFRKGMEKADPAGELRKKGEFFQTFTAKPQEMDFVANHPIQYQEGNQFAPPSDAFPPGTTHVMHSHPPAPAGLSNAFPSAHDYLNTYLASEGGRHEMHGIMLHAGEDRPYAFDGKVNPQTGSPEFERLTRSGIQQVQEWMAKHGYGGGS